MNQSAVVQVDQPSLTPFQVIERVITQGDLSKMQPAERVAFYWRTCESLGLNALTRPFEFIVLNGKMVMYARKDATDQLRKLNAVSVTDVRREKDEDLGLLTVYARGRDKTGREDEATGVVSIKGLSGEALANAVMKAETKAKRRLTLSLVGLGFLDESELDGAGADVDPTTGEIITKAPPATLLDSVNRQRAKMAEATDDAAIQDGQGDAGDGGPEAPPADPSWTAAPPASPGARLLEQLRTNAEASALTGPMTQPQQASLAKTLAPLKGSVGTGLAIAFGAEAAEQPTAAQAQALINVAASLGPDDFVAAWKALIEEGAAA